MASNKKVVCKKKANKKKTEQEHEHRKVCFIAMYSRDKIMRFHSQYFLSRLNPDFLQCAVYESNAPNARRIGIEYMVSNRFYQVLPEAEQKFWHPHNNVVKLDHVWRNPQIMETLEMPETPNLGKTWGKFWSTWQVDVLDAIPRGAPSPELTSETTLNWVMGKPEMPPWKIKDSEKRSVLKDNDAGELEEETEQVISKRLTVLRSSTKMKMKMKMKMKQKRELVGISCP